MPCGTRADQAFARPAIYACNRIDLAQGVTDANRGPIHAFSRADILQWETASLLHQRVVTSIIIGAKRIEQEEDNLAATKVTLSPPELDALDRVSMLPAEYPGWMFERQSARPAGGAERSAFLAIAASQNCFSSRSM
jgi:hypothetical protein